MMQAEETWALVSIFFVHAGQAALDSSWIVLEADGKSAAREIPLPDILKGFAAFPKLLPRLLLF
jgi:hypothetical protein